MQKQKRRQIENADKFDRLVLREQRRYCIDVSPRCRHEDGAFRPFFRVENESQRFRLSWKWHCDKGLNEAQQVAFEYNKVYLGLTPMEVTDITMSSFRAEVLEEHAMQEAG